MLEALIHDRIDEPPVLVVAGDERLARHSAVGERDDLTVVAVHLAVGEEAGRDTPVHGAEVAHRVPHARPAARPA